MGRVDRIRGGVHGCTTTALHSGAVRQSEGGIKVRKRGEREGGGGTDRRAPSVIASSAGKA
jgi:hypothetical protein